jgi:ABC-2 type transport system permease protein
MIANAGLLVVQVVVVLVIGLLLGLHPVTGFVGLLAVLGLSILLGISFSGLTIGVALLSGSSAATSSASFLFFPLTFLTATFVPVDLLQGWFKVAAYINPVTYFLDATRAILNTGWDATLIARGLLMIAIMFVVLFAFALYSLRVRTRRR